MSFPNLLSFLESSSMEKVRDGMVRRWVIGNVLITMEYVDFKGNYKLFSLVFCMGSISWWKADLFSLIVFKKQNKNHLRQRETCKSKSIFNEPPSSFPSLKQLTPLWEMTQIPSCAMHVTTFNNQNQTECDGGTIYELLSLPNYCCNKLLLFVFSCMVST